MRILIIEDDQEIARLLRRLLERDGHSIHHVADGDAGVQAFDTEAFEVVLCDGLLPKKQGIEVCALIRRHARGRMARIVMMSAAFRSAQAKSDAFLDGRIDAFLTKPFVAEDLRKAIQPAMPPGARTISQEGGVVRVVDASPRPPTGSSKPGLPEGIDATATRDVVRFLLRCARERFEGEIRFRAGEDKLSLFMVRGVIVGAVDNLREHEFGTWLLRRGLIDDGQYQALQGRLAQGGRVADTLVAMGLLSSTVMLSQLEEQLHVRVRRSLLWRGRIEAVVFADMSAKASGMVDLIDTIIRAALAHEAEATSFVTEHAGRTITRGADFEHGLSVLAQVRPTSRLPQLLLSRDCIVAEAALTGAPVEIHALVLAEQFAFADEPRDRRPIPQPIKRPTAPALVDADLVAVTPTTPSVPSLLEEAHGLCLRVRDGAYQLLQVSMDQPSSAVLVGLQKLRDRFGPTAFQQRGMVADDSVRELWESLTELVIVFADDDLRSAYDAQLTSERVHTPRAVDPIEQLLGNEQWAAARPLLEQRRLERPNDATIAAWLGRVLGHLGEPAAAVELLQLTIQRHPQSILPGLELAELAERQQNIVAAQAWFRWCLERSPDDARVHAGLRRVG